MVVYNEQALLCLRAESVTSGGLFKGSCSCPNPAGHQHLSQMQVVATFDIRDLPYTLLCSSSANRSVTLKTKELRWKQSKKSDHQGASLKLSKTLQVCISSNRSPGFCILVKDPTSQRSVLHSLTGVPQHALPAAFGCSFTGCSAKECSGRCSEPAGGTACPACLR